MSIYDPAAYGDGCAPYYDQMDPNVPGGAFLCETFDEGAEAGPATHSYPVVTPAGPVHYGVTFLPTPSRVLDELADAAGLALSSRWGSWARAPFVPGRPHCISVYRTPVTAP